MRLRLTCSLVVLTVLSGLIAGGGLSGCGASKPAAPTYRTVTEVREQPLPERPHDFGITLPVPEANNLVRLSSVLLSSALVIPVVVSVDTAGRCSEPTPVDEADSGLVMSVADRLSELTFLPGKRDSVLAPMKLPMLFLIREDSTLAGLVTPINRLFTITDARLYEYALALNGYNVARLTSFPSYFCQKPPGDTIVIPPYLAVNVSLDENGRPRRIDAVGPEPPLTDQVLTAVNWAKYRPASRDGEPVSGEVQITITLWPEQNCPTDPLSLPPGDSLDVYDRTRVAQNSAFSDLRMLPVPANLSSNGVYPDQPVANLPDTGLVIIRIDREGRARLVSSDPSTPHARRSYEKVVASLRFHPAVGKDGEPLEYTGKMALYRTDSRNVRIKCFWLFPPDWLTKIQVLANQ